MKKIFLILSIFCFIYHSSCTNSTLDKEIEYQLPTTFQPTDKIRYNVEGGGQIDFFVENNLDSLYIFVLSYQFLPKNDSLTISKLDLDSLDLVTIEALFQGTINIGGIIYRNVLPTGTWTYLYINNNNTWLRVANETIINELFSFYHLVCENINKD